MVEPPKVFIDTHEWWNMSTSSAQSPDDLTKITPFLVLGAGFVAMFAGFEYFFVIWIIGFAVLLPIIAILSGENDENEDDEWEVEDTQHPTSSSSSSTQDALSTLRERYANGDLTDEQFERKLDRLLKTETPEDAEKWREVERNTR
jgi:uncharacterized membrane protein